MTSDYYRDKAALEEMLTHLPPAGQLTADQIQKKSELQTLLTDAEAAGNQSLRQKVGGLHDAHEAFLGSANDVKRQVGKGLRAANLDGAANGLCSLLERLWAESEDGAKTTEQFISDLRAAFGKSSHAAPVNLKKVHPKSRRGRRSGGCLLQCNEAAFRDHLCLPGGFRH